MLGDVGERGTCTTCKMSEDFSNYWTVILYFKHENGSYHRVPVTNIAALATGTSGGMTIYYTQHDFWNDDVNNTPITAFPPGFRMMVGSPTHEYTRSSQGPLAFSKYVIECSLGIQ
ncbi:putative DUF1996 domain-containing protein [Seiridium cardinale]|uniref:DUF1996 domain-containing protein n=1 Tax=Seiridium cardinale TaxID=138064 RepID=A0ABR2Y618_9PEZI